MDATVRLGPLKFSLRATIDHHGPSIHSGHYTASINCCNKTFYCDDHTITEFGIIDSKNSSTAYVILYELIDTFGLEHGGGSLIVLMALAHPLHPIDNKSRNRRRQLWVGWSVSSWWPFFPSRSSVSISIYIFCFLCFINCVLLSDDTSLTPGCLWLLAFVLYNTLILGIWCFTILHHSRAVTVTPLLLLLLWAPPPAATEGVLWADSCCTVPCCHGECVASNEATSHAGAVLMSPR